MKQSCKIALSVLTGILLFACKEDDDKGNVKPQMLVEYYATPISGGALITYTIPKDDNILYVMAEYERNGTTFVERSSIYNNSLVIQGFNTVDEVTATLYTVNHYEKRSDPMYVSFRPDKSPLAIVYESLQVEAGFGGVIAQWENPTGTELGVRLMVVEDGEYIEKEMYFSVFPETHPFRGFEDVRTTFAFSFEDKWGNTSDTAVFPDITPLPEYEVYGEGKKDLTDKKSWQALNIPYDNYSENPTCNRGKLFNNITHVRAGNEGMYESWLTLEGTDRSATFTIDLKDTYKMSRMKIWPRMQNNQGEPQPYHSGQPYTVNNVLSFELWGIDEFPAAKLSDKGYWLDNYTMNSFVHEGVTISSPSYTDEWIFLGRYNIERLDLMGASSDEIVQRALDGNEFDILPADPVRYIRFVVLETDKGSPTPGGVFQIAELSFWGNNKLTP